MRARRGFTTLLYIVITALILMIWGTAQHYTSAAVRRRVLIAEGGRRCLVMATTAVEEGIEIFASQMNEGPPPGAPESAGSVARKAREIRPGEVLNFSLKPPVATLPGGGPAVHLSSVSGRLFIVALDGQVGQPPPSLTKQAYRAYLIKWARRPGCPAEMVADERKLFGDYRPPTAKGILEFTAIASTEISGVPVYKAVAVRHQVQLAASPFAEVLAEVMGTGLSSMLHIEPLELGRRIWSQNTEAAPPRKEAKS